MKAVLVVEDEPLIRLSLVETLRAKNYEVDEARDGQSAIALIAAKTFDALICDSHMPGTISGLDVLLHYHEQHPDKVKVLLTGQTSRETEDQIQGIGGTYLTKPFAVEELVVMLARLLQARE
jgi:DNA-binding response OmpR family regulator